MKVYIVEGSCGEYSSYTSWAVCVVRTQERANELVRKLTDLQEYTAKILHGDFADFEKSYHIANPYPVGPKMPQAPTSYNIKNKKMLAQAIDVYHRQYEKYKVHLNEFIQVREKHFKDRQAAIDAWFAEHFSPAEELKEVLPFVDIKSIANNSYGSIETEMID